MRRILIALLGVLLLASTASAQSGANPLSWTTAQKRSWLRSQIAAKVTDPDALRDAVVKLDRMSDAQLDALIRAGAGTSQQAQLAAAQAQLQREIALRNQLLQQYQMQQYYGGAPYGRAPVGYRPVITTLPTGASLSAGAVVSPDRRYVRINAMPFFSTVGPVHTFNYNTGQTGVYSPYGPGYPTGYGGVYTSPYAPSGGVYSSYGQPQQKQPQVWFDGLRARYSVR